MIATYSRPIIQNAQNMAPKKEMIRCVNAVLFCMVHREIRSPIIIRWYKSRYATESNHVIHCSIWIRGLDNVHLSGYGNASGYGYDKFSSSFSSALDSAEIKLDEDIDGAGMDAVRNACVSICKMLGYSAQPTMISN